MFSNPFSGSCIVDGVPTLQCIPNIFPIIVALLILFAFIACLILIVYSGFRFITSGGDEKQVEGARHTLTYAILGLVLVLASFFIVQFISKTTGVGCINVFSFNSCLSNSTPGTNSCRGVCKTKCTSGERVTSGTCSPTIGGNDRVCCN